MIPVQTAKLLLARAWRGLRPSGGQRQQYVFESDGLATAHYSPFLDDDQFNTQYYEMRREWFPDAAVDVRWRLWLMTRVARHCAGLDGNFVEFGVYRAGCAFMILSTGAFSDSKRFYLFDTFAGIPTANLTASERAAGLAGAHADTSVDYVRGRIAPWQDRVVLVPGDVSDTLDYMETGQLAFVHMDLNARDPTVIALNYAFPRLVPGGIILFDDYGWSGLEAQRDVVDSYLSDRSEEVLPLPTGQALLVKK